MSNYLNIMRAGDDYVIKVTVMLDGVPTDITGYKYWFTVKSAFADVDTAAILQFSSTVGDNVNDVAASGICYLSIPASSTKDIPAGSYFYDIQQRAPNVGPQVGSLKTILPPANDYKDKLTVIPEVTKAIA